MTYQEGGHKWGPPRYIYPVGPRGQRDLRRANGARVRWPGGGAGVAKGGCAGYEGAYLLWVAGWVLSCIIRACIWRWTAACDGLHLLHLLL